MSLLDTRAPFFIAYLKGEEAKLVTSNHISKMSKVANIPDAVDVIKDTDIGSYLDRAAVRTFEDVDEHLWAYLGACITELEWFEPVPPVMLKVIKAYITKYDVFNIKAALQAISIGKKARMIPAGIIHKHGLLEKLSGAEDTAAIIAILNTCGLGNYIATLEGYEIGGGGSKAKQLAEVKLDEEYNNNLLKVARAMSNDTLLTKAFGTIIDLANLKIILRAIITEVGPEIIGRIPTAGYLISGEKMRELLTLKLGDLTGKVNFAYQSVIEEVVSNYNKTRNITVIDEFVDKNKFRMLKEMLSPHLTPSLVTAWYLTLKETEIRSLRITLKAISDNIPVEEIRTYLVPVS